MGVWISTKATGAMNAAPTCVVPPTIAPALGASTAATPTAPNAASARSFFPALSHGTYLCMCLPR